MNKADVVEFANQLSDKELVDITVKLTEKRCGDLGDALEALSKNSKLDSVLASAPSANDLFNMCDSIRDILQKECKKKGFWG